MIVAIEQLNLSLTVNCLTNHPRHFRIHIDRVAIYAAQTTNKNA